MAKGIKTGGRKPGTPNRCTVEIREAAQHYGINALETLASIMATSPNDQARIAAARELLDRGYGKPSQAIEGASERPQPIPVNQRVPLELYEDALRRVLEEY